MKYTHINDAKWWFHLLKLQLEALYVYAIKEHQKKSNKFRDPLQRETTQNTEYGEAYKF